MRYVELLERQNYEVMFRPFIELVSMSYEGFVRRQIADVQKSMKKNDRIVWYLRLWRIGMMDHFVRSWTRKAPADVDATIIDKLNNLLKSYLYQYSQASRLPEQTVSDRADAIATEPHSYKERLEHFLSLPIPEIQNHVFQYDDPVRVLQSFANYEKEWQESRRGLIPAAQAEEAAEAVLRFPNGYTWWLINKSSCSLEADAMGHCGNAGTKRDDRILSLRKTEKRGKEMFYAPYLTFILMPNGKLGEMKGRFNNSPIHAFQQHYAPSDFHDEIFALLKLPMIKGITGGGYLPEENFKVADLPSEQIEALAEIKPNMLPLKLQYKRQGITADLIEQIEAAVDTRTIQYDPASKAFIWDDRPNLADFIETYVKVDSKHRRAVALWLLDVFSGDETLEYYDSSDEQKEDLLRDFERKHPDDHAKLVAHIEQLWDAEHDDFDPDEEDRPELLEMIDEVDPEFDSTLGNAVSDGLSRGAENEMSEYFDKWLDDLKKPGDFFITLPEWDEQYYQSACNVMVDVPTVIDLIDENRLEEDELFEVEDVDEPYYGFSGYDEDAALEYLMDNLPGD